MKCGFHPPAAALFKSDILEEQPLTSPLELRATAATAAAAASDGSSSAHTHAARKESTQRPNATASRSWICLLQISRDILAITVTERWENDFGWARAEEEAGTSVRSGLVLAPMRVIKHTYMHRATPCYNWGLFGLSCWHEPLIICN